MENGTPPDIQSLLLRFGAMEKELACLKAENTRLKSELARKDKIIAGLQQRLFGSSSEKLDPAQLQFELDQLLLGKPVPPPDPSGETSAPEEEKTNAARTRRTKADRFPKNLKILVESITIPEQVLANPGDWQEIGEEHHDELDVIKAEIFWRRTIRKKFVHKTDKTRPPVIAPAPVPSIPGTIHSDGYSVYDAVATKHGLRHAGCLAHIRRKFTDLGKASPEVTLPVLHLIQRLYQIETQTRRTEAPPACRELIRRARSRPVADELHHFILTHLKTHLPASNVGQALGYTLHQWPQMQQKPVNSASRLEGAVQLAADPENAE